MKRPGLRSMAIVLAVSGITALGACSKEDQAKVKEAANEAASKAQSAASEAAAKATTLADSAKDAAGTVAQSAKDTAGSAADAARDAAAKAGEAAREVGEKITAAGSDAASRLGSAAAKADASAGNLASTVSESAKALADQARQSAAALTAKAAESTAQLSDKLAGSDVAAPGGNAAGNTTAEAAAAGAAVAAAVGSAAAGTPGAAPAATQPLKAAWVYIGPVGDGGWTFAHDNGRKAAQAAMGNSMVSTIVESVPESADAERVFRDLALQGNKIIFGTTFGYMETMRKLSREFPDIYWEHATGYKTTENLRSYDSRTYEGAYLAGLIAGAMTTSNSLGVVGSVPIPEVIRNINSFTLGAQRSNPAVSTRVVWVNKWFDPPRESEAAQSLIDQGADVLFQNTDSAAVLQTAEKAGKLAFGWDSDMTGYGPKAHLASAVIHWGPYYTSRVKAAAAGTWKTGSDWWGVPEGAIDIVSLSDKLPEDVRSRVQAARAGLRDRSLAVWQGPIVDNTGKEVVAAGQVADDKFLGGVNFYVKGVEGTVPRGN